MWRNATCDPSLTLLKLDFAPHCVGACLDCTLQKMRASCKKCMVATPCCILGSCFCFLHNGTVCPYLVPPPPNKLPLHTLVHNPHASLYSLDLPMSLCSDMRTLSILHTPQPSWCSQYSPLFMCCTLQTLFVANGGAVAVATGTFSTRCSVRFQASLTPCP